MSEESPEIHLVDEPDPEVVAKPTRRRFTARQKLAFLEEVEHLRGTGEIGAYLREHGLYSSQLSVWRQAFEEGGLEALEPKTRGPKPLTQDELERRDHQRELEDLRKQNAELTRKLAQADAMIEVQKKLARLMETLDHDESSK